MTKKDFVLIAVCLNRFKPSVGSDRELYLDRILDQLAVLLASTNPRFNVERFLKASGHSQYRKGE